MTAGLQRHQQAAPGDAEVTRPGTETAGCSQANQTQEAEYGLASDYGAVQVAVAVELELQGLKGQESLLLTVDQLAVGPSWAGKKTEPSVEASTCTAMSWSE